MRIVILGAGHLGYTIAELLSNEQHDVVVADSDEKSYPKSATRWMCSRSPPTGQVRISHGIPIYGMPLSSWR